MPKEYGHTKTLFKRGKKYFWSYKYDHCKVCGKVDKPHKGNGLCISCYEKERAKTSKRRKITVKINQTKYWLRRRIKHILKTPKKRPTGYLKLYGPSDPKRTKEIMRKSNKKWREKNKERLLIMQKVYRWKKAGKKMMKMCVNGKDYFFPFEALMKKPPMEDPKYKDYLKQQKEFNILHTYYLSKGAKK